MIRSSPTMLREASLAAALAAMLTLAACGGEAPGQDGPPDAPKNVTTTAGPGYVIVDWEHDGARTDGYSVTRQEGSASAALASRQSTTFDVDADTREYVDATVEPGATYTYAVAATGADGTSQGTAPPADAAEIRIAPGIDLNVGTVHRGVAGWAGTAFVVYYVLPEAVRTDAGLVFEVEIDGPAGWNDGVPHTFSHDGSSSSRAAGWSWAFDSGADAVDGDYTATLTITGGTEPVVHTVTVPFDDADFLLGPPIDISFSAVGTTGLTTSWTNPPGTMASLVSLWRGEYDEAIEQWTPTYDTSHTFDGVDLEDAVHMIEVVAFNFDFHGYPVKVDPMGASVDTRLVTVGGAISPLCEDAGELVAIPDAALETAVREEVGVATGPLTCSDLARLERLDADGQGVASLDGLEVAENLGYLQLNGGNDVSDLTPILGLTGLTGLGLDLNPIADHAVLGVFTDLTYLSVGGTGATDLEFVDDMTQLERLYAWDNAISDLGPLADTTTLRTLYLIGNAVTDLAPIAGSVGMEELYLGWNDVDDLLALSGMTSLRELNLSGNPVGDADVWPIVEQQTDLEEFEAELTSVTDASTLAGLANLRFVDLSNTGVTDVSFVSSLDQLASLFLDGNALADPSQLVGASGLEELGVDGTGLADLGFVTSLTQLGLLDVSDNDVTDIAPLVDNVGLGDGDTVYLDGNPLDANDPDVAADLQALVDRGVELSY